MNKENLLKLVAESGYNLGYGAKKHFATFDLIEKLPGWLGFFAFVIGIFALFTASLATPTVSAWMLVFAVSTLYINGYNSEKANYDNCGKRLTGYYNDLRTLYYEVKSLPETTNFAPFVVRHKEIYDAAFVQTVSKQILFSDWYAHYKFFWQQQIEWIDEQKHFKLFRDKIPLTFTFSVVLLASAIGAHIACKSFSICVWL